MPTSPSASLRRHLALHSSATTPGNPTSYLIAGAACLKAGDLIWLRRLLPQIRRKAAAITGSPRLRRRIELLADYLQESPAAGSNARREIAFALCYFLKGYDFIPDSIPEIGLLDDALLVESALQRNQHELHSHWTAGGRTWPDVN